MVNRTALTLLTGMVVYSKISVFFKGVRVIEFGVFFIQTRVMSSKKAQTSKSIFFQDQKQTGDRFYLCPSPVGLE